jgi:Ca2+-binding EF-hand superfamily protein
MAGFRFEQALRVPTVALIAVGEGRTHLIWRRRSMQNQMSKKLAIGVVAVCSFTLSGAGAWAGGGGAEHEMKMMDGDGDGKITASEHEAGAKKMFEKMDLDKDGKVTASEMEAAHEKVTGAKAMKTDMSAADKIKVIDTNGDGTVTAQEHAAGAKMMFDKMDTNKDGTLSKTECAEGHDKMLHGKGAKDPHTDKKAPM